MNTALLSLGTNLGNKLENLNLAIQQISELGKVNQISSVYQTPPWGFKSDDFYNIAINLQTELDAESLINKLLYIETKLGRTRNNATKGYQARPLDIDIIFYNTDIINTKTLTVPHPRMQDRNFVLIPIIEIISNFEHPVLQKKLEILLDECNDNSMITKTKHQL
ncbi:2-amino-4-hydroxy-6-hydroxymethyldihydropteridine diphosphokinase [Wenyingzhuangia heitensis]|uniref:2-amino-4-hydroxy-6-hydroxymethyldihydropteridine pyrophosphokinase n=1 Tax=Wenyingzhuangia heitensis TaxID=1487859 RepID=A0ABX0UFA2_9FLAO|nr:2-amino-4-hydroxy-6-hydroxymethyldihydropteridine diphosphokinase [Wenyingzhuangia heitensis]NIJ46221.1 2-amino-4-hydroxy-6-hydroxymethyldihydropteridine diphosphokinase [Wenyingzhuangia heitensis]